MKKIYVSLTVFALLAIGLCLNGLAHFGNIHVADARDHECCDMTAATHHEASDLTTFPPIQFPQAILTFFIFTLALLQSGQIIFKKHHSPYFFHKFSRGVFQLE